MKSKASRSGPDRPPDLFSLGSEDQREPLAERMRPRTFREFVGQDQIVGEGRLLRRAIETGHLTSIILYGPPGTGKTTIANIIAHETKAHFVTLNAVLDGVKELREVVDAAEKQFSDERTLLFVDHMLKSDHGECCSTASLRCCCRQY
jgi:putative ATPase